MEILETLRPLAGGVLIGLSAVTLLYFNGRVAGISGMLRGLLNRPDSLFLQHLLFLLALVGGAWLYESWAGTAPTPRPDFPAALLALAGVLVGFGTSMAGGCTSGHGVCGMSRLSPRSLVAVPVFLGTAMLTTYVVRQWLHIQ